MSRADPQRELILDMLPKTFESDRRFRSALGIGVVLLASGIGHLAWLGLTGADWAGPLSLRKPALFGISAGLTVGSMVWVMRQMVPHRWDKFFMRGLSIGLLVEVGLITVQYWRGVPSHFNRTTGLDAFIETTMLILILGVTLGITWLCVRSWWLLPMPAAQALALRAGLWFLLVSCGLGVAITVLGDVQLANGNSPELWGRAGVLKYPHGATLHAIQTLPLISALLGRLRIRRALDLVRAAVAAHVLLLFQALWQTSHGLGRLDLDWVGGAALAIAAVFLLLTPFAIIAQIAPRMRV